MEVSALRDYRLETMDWEGGAIKSTQESGLKEVKKTNPSVFEVKGGTGLKELENLQAVIKCLIPGENYVEGETNLTPIDISQKDFETLKATVNALIEFQSIPQWEDSVRSVIHSLIRILSDFDKLFSALGATIGNAGKMLVKPIRATIDKLQNVLEAMKPSGE